jgi:hypothetical protein
MSDHHEQPSFPERFWQPFVISLGVFGVLCLIFFHPVI